MYNIYLKDIQYIYNIKDYVSFSDIYVINFKNKAYMTKENTK